MRLFTIGYGGRPPAELVGLLRQHGVAAVVDVRIRPDRSSMGAYVLAKSPAKGIQRLLADAGIDYVSVPALGNPFKDEQDWKERYEQFLRDGLDAKLARLDGVREPFCLLCAEKRVENCHRRQIAQALAERGVTVTHIV